MHLKLNSFNVVDLKRVNKKAKEIRKLRVHVQKESPTIIKNLKLKRDNNNVILARSMVSRSFSWSFRLRLRQRTDHQ